MSCVHPESLEKHITKFSWGIFNHWIISHYPFDDVMRSDCFGQVSNECAIYTNEWPDEETTNGSVDSWINHWRLPGLCCGFFSTVSSNYIMWQITVFNFIGCFHIELLLSCRKVFSNVLHCCLSCHWKSQLLFDNEWLQMALLMQIAVWVNAPLIKHTE